MAKSEENTSASWIIAGRGKKQTLTIGIARAETEARAPTWTGGHNSGEEAEATDIEVSEATATDRVITEEVRVTEMVAMAEETGTKEDNAEGIGVNVGATGIQPISSTPNID